MPSFALVSLGCPKNQVDSERIIDALVGLGLEFEADSFKADLVLINTCAFIESAREEAVETILSYAALKREKPGMRIAVAGCLVQGFEGEVKEALHEVDFWLRGPADTVGLAELARAVSVDAGEGSVPADRSCPAHPPGRPGRVESPRSRGPSVSAAAGAPGRSILLGEAGSAYLKVSEGCDNRCNYCSIPLIKGGLSSRTITSLRREMAILSELDVKELVIVGQDLSSYGKDLPGGPGLADLVEEALSFDFRWIRLMYVYPGRLDERVVELMGREERLCAYLDMPLQHSHPKVLRAMGRETAGRNGLELVEELRSRIPGLVLRTTFITGHPGEGTREFRHLLDFVEKARFEWLGVFPYSPEPGTPSFDMPRRPRPSTALRRAREVEEVFRAVRRTDAFGPGRVKEVLVIDVVDDILVCRSESEAPEVDGVILAGPVVVSAPRPGETTFVRLVEEDGMDFLAEHLGPGGGPGGGGRRREG